MSTGVGFWGSSSPSQSGLAIGNATLPPEGPRAVPFQFDFTVIQGYAIQVSDLMSKGPGKPGLSVIQGFYADNSQSASPLKITVTGTGQNIIIPPGSEGYLPILSPTGGIINVSSNGGIVIPLYIYNVPLPTILWNSAATSSFQFISGGVASGSLKTADQNISPLINNRGFLNTNALDVNVVYNAGTSLLYEGLISASGSTTLVSAMNQFSPIHKVVIIPTANIAQATAGLNNIRININPNDVCQLDFWVPAAVPATPVNGPAYTFDFNATPFINSSATGNPMTATLTTALTSGAVRLFVYGQQQ